MAIFHCAVSHGSRKDGQSGAAKVDYITRSGKYIGDAREVIDAWAGHLPSWTGGNPRELFAAADLYERANARLFTQVLFALPNELSDADALLVAYHYAEAVTENGAPYVLAVHRGGGGVPDGKSAAAEPKEAADDQELPPHNRHAHLVICERVDDGLERTAREWFRRANKKEPALGGAAKDRTMNGGNWVPEARHLCADYINYGLERGGFSERVTCESHETRIARAEAAGDEKTAEQLRLKPPGIHLGPTAWAIEKDRPGRPWRPSWRGNLARVIAAEGERIRGKVEVLNAQLSELDAREAAVTEELEAARRVAAVQFEQREEALLGTSMGEDLLRGARIEVAGETGATLSVVEHGQVVEIAQQRFGAALDLREAGFRKTSVGSRYLIETAQSILGEAQSPTPPQRELIITTAESRLGRELDEREAPLRASAAGVEVLGGVQLERADEYGTVLTLVQREQLVDTAERRLRERRKAEQEEVRALDRREETLGSMSTGAHHLAAAARELFGEEKQARTLPDRELMIGEAERRVEEELRGREEALRASVLAGRAVIVTEVEQRLGRELDSREEELVLSACCDELLVEAFSELCASDASFGDGSSLSERSQIIALAERRLEGDRAEDAERSAALDDLEAMLKETSSGAQYLAAAQQEVLGEGKEPATLDERDSVVMTAWRRVEQELDGRAQALAARRCEDGSVEVGGAWLYAIKLTELEAGQQQNDGPSPGCREQALAWAGQQMDRLDALRQEEALDLFFEKLVELEPARGPADIAEEEQRAAAARRQDRVDALSEDELVFVEEKRDALDPQGREVGPWKPAHVAAAVAYAHARVEALDEEIERRRTIIEQTPGDGYARLLAAGFGEASRQQKMEALTVIETDLAEDFDRREERIRTAGEGEEFLRRGRLEVLGAADRQPETLPERGGVIEAAAAHQRRAARHQLISEAAESRRAAQRQDLFQQPGAEDLYYAWLADLDPTWVPGGQTAAANIDAALSATASDSGRLGLLRDVLADPVDAACYRAALYRAVLGVRRDRFTVADLDAAVAEALRRRAIAAARKREEEKRELEAKEHRAARYEALSDAGQELYTARLTALASAGSRAGGPPGAVVDRALDETESDCRLQDLEAIFADAEHRSDYRGLLVASGDQVTLEQIDTALKATEAVVRRKQTIFEYPGNKEYPDGGALYTAAREALAPDWRPGAELPAGLLDQVESQLADRVRGAADIVEASIPTTQPWSHRPDYRVPAVSDKLLDQLVQDDDNAFFKATVAELRKRYARRAHYDTPSAERYDGAARQASQQKHLDVPPWSTVLARLLKGYLSRLREIVLAACDKILGGDLWERLARRRTQVERAADAAETGLPRTRPDRYRADYQVPAVSNETLEQVVTDESTPFLKEVVAEVCDRYDRRAHAAYEERYDHEARRKSEWSHLNEAIEIEHGRAKRSWSRFPHSSPHPTRKAAEASVTEKHQSAVLEAFEVACDEVVGRGELGARLRKHREQVQRAANAAAAVLPTRPDLYRANFQVPAVSDETLEQVVTDKSAPFLKEVVAEVCDRYDRRAHAAYEERYDHEARRKSEWSHLNEAIEIEHGRAKRLWSRSPHSSPHPTRKAAEASVTEKHQSAVLEAFEVACDEVVGRGELGARLRKHREQVQRAANAAAAVLPTRPDLYRANFQVPAVSDETLEQVVTDKSAPFLKEVVAEVCDRYDRRARLDVGYEERYDHEARRRSEWSHLNEAIEIEHGRAKRLWSRSPHSSPHPTRKAAEASVTEKHQSAVLEAFEVACDEVVGRGELGARLRKHREQVQRAAAAAAAALPSTPRQSYGRPVRHVPAVSDETLAEVRADAGPFLEEVIDVVWDRYDRHAGIGTSYEERYDDAARRQSEEDCLAGPIATELEGLQDSWCSSTREAARLRVVKDYRSRIRGIFTAARDEVLRVDELADRQQAQSVRPPESPRTGAAGTSTGRRRAAEQPSESAAASAGHDRTSHGAEQQGAKEEGLAGQDSTIGCGSRGDQGLRPRATEPVPEPDVSVTEADRVRLAVHAMAAKLPRTQPYDNPSHRPPALSDERFNRMAAATDDEFVRKVIAAVQEKGNYYTDFERTESEKSHLRPAVGKMYQDALDEYEKAKAKRWIFSKRSPKPTWTEAEAAVIKEFISEQLGVIKEICREVQQRTPAAVRSELQRFEPGQVVTPRPSKSRTRATNQQGRGDSGPSR